MNFPLPVLQTESDWFGELDSLEEAQAAVGSIQRRMQDQYTGWEEMAADFDAAALERGFGDGRLQLRPAAREIWNVVPFK